MGSLYDDLGVSRSANSRQVKAAYRALVKRLHPDLNPQTPATAAHLAKVNAAYAVLGHENRRAAYDAELGRIRRIARWRIARQGVTSLFTFAAAFSGIMFGLSGFEPERPHPEDWVGDRSELRVPSKEMADKRPESESLSRDGDNAPPDSGPVHVSAPPSPPLPRLSLLDEARPKRGDAPAWPRPIASYPHLHESEFETISPSGAPVQPRSRDGPRGPRPGRVRPPDATMIARRRAPPHETRVATPKPPLVSVAEHTAASKKKQDGEPIPRQRAVALLAAAESIATSRSAPIAWKSVDARRLGFAFRYPASHFPTVRWSDDRRDLLAMSKSGNAVIRARTQGRPDSESLTALRRRLLAGRYSRAELVEDALTDTELTIAGRLGGEFFFERFVVACGRSIVRRFLVVYPDIESALFAPLTAAIKASLRMDGSLQTDCGAR